MSLSALLLDVTPIALAAWLREEKAPPIDVFLNAVADVVVADNLELGARLPDAGGRSDKPLC